MNPANSKRVEKQSSGEKNPKAGWVVRWASFLAGVVRSLLSGGTAKPGAARKSRREEKQRRKGLVRQAKATKRLRKAA